MEPELNQEPYPRLPTVEGLVLVKTEKLISIDKVERKDGSGTFENYNLQLIISGQRDGVKLLGRHLYRATGINGKYMSDQKENGVWIGEITKRNQYYNLRHVYNLRDLTDMAVVLEKAK